MRVCNVCQPFDNKNDTDTHIYIYIYIYIHINAPSSCRSGAPCSIIVRP